MENRFLDVRDVVGEMTRETWRNLHELTILKAFILSVMGGSFITFGALFSILLSAGVQPMGVSLLLQGLGFSAGFFMVILTGALLFSESNVVLPASVLNCSTKALVQGALRFWVITIIGNITGALITGYLINFAQDYPPEIMNGLEHVIHKKLYYFRGHTTSFWLEALISGILGNWLVGMAAVFATMGKTIIGKYIPVWLAVSLFVAANFQHSPANMGYFSLIMPTGAGPGWGNAILWNLLPAAIGNVIGGTLLVALPFWYVLTEKEKSKLKS